MDKEYFKCICCDNDEYKILSYNNYGYRNLENQKRNIFLNLSIHLCNKCGFSSSYPLIDQNDLNEFYNRDYSSAGSIHATGWEDKVINYKNRISWRYLSQLFLVKSFRDIINIHNVLEIGPGYCEGKKTLDRMKWNGEYYVFEEDYTKYDLIKRHKIQILKNQKDNYFIESFSNKFDLTIMSHSLEHFQSFQILEIINSIYKMSKNNGMFLIEVPSDDFRFDELEVNHSPHLCFFSVQSFKSLIEKTKFKIIFLNQVGGIKINMPYQKPNPSNLKILLKNIKSVMVMIRILRSIQKITRILVNNIAYYFFTNYSGLFSDNFNYGKGREGIRCLLIKEE
jgi:hypothetical protein